MEDKTTIELNDGILHIAVEPDGKRATYELKDFSGSPVWTSCLQCDDGAPIKLDFTDHSFKHNVTVYRRMNGTICSVRGPAEPNSAVTLWESENFPEGLCNKKGPTRDPKIIRTIADHYRFARG